MMQGTIETTDMQLSKLLIARKLKDGGVTIAETDITTVRGTGHDQTSKVCFRYPLGGTTVGIRSHVGDLETITFDRVLGLAQEQAGDYGRLLEACGYLKDHLAEAAHVAKREVAKANRRGMCIRLLRVLPSIIDAGAEWLPWPEVSFEILDDALMPERMSVTIESVGEIAQALSAERLLEKQIVRAARKRWFDSNAADGAIDAILLAALTSRGHDVPDVIRRMRENRNGFLLGDGDARMNVWWDDGLINASVGIDRGVEYQGGKLTIEASHAPSVDSGFVGLPARIIADSDLLEGATIATVVRRFDKHVVTLEPRYLVYDAATLEPRDQLFRM